MNKSYKYRFYPNQAQAEMLAKTFGCVRFVYNHILDWRSKEYTNNQVKINYVASAKKLTEIKQKYDWLYDVSNVALQQTLRHQDLAFSNFFAKRAKYPSFKKKSKYQSFRLTTSGFRIKDNKFYIAKSKEPLNVKLHRKYQGEVTSVTISKDSANRYFISLCCEHDIKQLPKNDKSIGLDVGLTHFVATSDNIKVKAPKATIKYQKKLARLSKRLSKKQKGSKNRNKARFKVAKLHNKIKDTRKDFLHKLSTDIIKNHDNIVIEDLNIAGLIKNRKLSKHIADASWSEFTRQLEYKAFWYSRNLIKINRFFPSSQICSHCGHREGKKALNIRIWTCQSCNTQLDRDINASINILNAGLAELKNTVGTTEI
jgi:putative transposase